MGRGEQEFAMSWLIGHYHPVALFSLRPTNATTSGGKTLISPTAFAIKMALLSACIQTVGIEEGKQRFPVIRDLRIALALPENVVVVQSFAKIQREASFKGKKEDRSAWEAAQIANGTYPFQPTIAYRELVQFGGPLQIAVATNQGALPEWLAGALISINYLGKRGGFLQIAGQPHIAEALASSDFTEITADSTTFAINGTLQMLDDCGKTMTFAHADIYDPKRIGLDKERVLRQVVLPYRLAQSSRGYSRYERIGEGVVAQ
jgi:hypothetical protein